MPQDSALVPRGRLGLETVLIKLSDLGISQFAATQGARGLVGTPGYMAPEILKYHGKEVGTSYLRVSYAVVRASVLQTLASLKWHYNLIFTVSYCLV